MPPDTSRTAPTLNAVGSGVPEGCDASAHWVSDTLLAELRLTFRALLGPCAHVVLAVSGGADSTALLHLAVAWQKSERAAGRQPPALSVATVDHRLRPGSAAEAAEVATQCTNLGLPHTTLAWTGAKPTTGIQVAARHARQTLLCQHLRDNGWTAVAMAHTMDDQAETLLMRLARGSGIDGLGAMRARSALGDDFSLLRPFLAVPKRTLVGYLRANQVPWIEDPSNQSDAFERVRVRQLLDAATAAGFGLDTLAVARSAARVARASDALAMLTRDAWSRRDTGAHFDALGYATLRWDWLLAQPEEIRLRLLAGLIDRIGGQDKSVSLGQLEDFTIGRHWRPRGLDGVTLHGTRMRDRVEGGTPTLVIMRETGRQPDGTLSLRPGTSVVWDRRFRVALAASYPRELQLGALGATRGVEATGRDQLARLESTLPAIAKPWPLEALPAVRDGAELVAVPPLGFARPDLGGRVQCDTLAPWFGD